MSKPNTQLIPQALTEMETQAMFDLLEQLEKQGWSYGANSNLMCGVFIGPNEEFDLWPSKRTGERTLQWSLQYPSTAQASGQPLGMHTLLWEYELGASDYETVENFLSAALKGIKKITAQLRY